MRPMTTRLRQGWLELRLRASRVTTASWLILVLGGAVFVLAGVLVPSARGRAIEAARALEEARSAGAAAAAAPLVPDRTEESRRAWRRFQQVLGDPRYGEQQVATLFAIARGLKLQLPQGQYRLTCDEGAPFCRMRMQLPLHGSDLVIRRFIEEVLRVIPFAALEEVSFRREGIGDAEVDAQLAFTLYMEPAPPVAGAPAP